MKVIHQAGTIQFWYQIM